MKKHTLILTLAFFCLIFYKNYSIGQTAADTGKFSLSLTQAIDYAIQHQTKVIQAGLDEQIAREKVRETVGIGLPQIGASATVQDFVEIPTSVMPAAAFNPAAPPDALVALQFGIQYNASAGIEITQLLFNSDYLVGLQASKTYLELSRKAAERSKTETKVAVTKAYYSVLLNRERLSLLDANLKRLEMLKTNTEALLKNGFVEQTESDRMVVTYENLKSEKENMDRLEKIGVRLLKFQMGMDQKADLTLTDKIEDLTFQIPAEADKIDYGKRSDYSLMLTQQNIAQLQLKRHRMSYLPTAALFGNASANAFSTKFDFFDTKKGWYPTLLVGAQIKIGIFDGLQTHRRIQQSKLELMKTESTLKMLQQSIDMEIASSYAAYSNAAASVQSKRKNMELAEKVFESTRKKYEQGLGSNLDVLSAETTLKEAQTNYLSALYDALIAKVDYEFATGILK